MTDRERMIARQTAIRAKKVATVTVETKKEKTREQLRDEAIARYKDSLREYEEESKDQTTKAFTDSLLAMGAKSARSVVKKCLFTGYNTALVEISNELTRDIQSVYNVISANDVNIMSLMTYDKDGELIDTKESKDARNKLYTIAHESLGDGLDLVHDAIIKLLEETASANGESGFLEETRTERQLSKRVFIREEDSKAYKDVEIMPIREVYRTVRRSISGSRAVESHNGKYTYIETELFDENGNEMEDCYKRLPKYMDIGGVVRDFNGGEVAYTANENDVETLDDIMERMNLTTRQALVLKYRLSGYGNKAIATYLGVSREAVKETTKQLRKKLVAIGIEPTKEEKKESERLFESTHFTTGKTTALKASTLRDSKGDLPNTFDTYAHVNWIH